MLLIEITTVILVIQMLVVNGYYSIYFHGGQADVNLVNLNKFPNSPTNEMVADICARLSGRLPLLREEFIDLAITIPQVYVKNPIIVEVVGDVMLDSLVQVFHSTDGTNQLPTLHNVNNILNSYNINPKVMYFDNANELALFMKSSSEPLIVLNYHRPNRALQTTDGGLTEFQISQYQIVLWTAIGVGLVLYSAIYSIVYMEVIPDSLLTAKFQSSRTGKQD